MNEPINKNPCGQCDNFDPVLRGQTGPGGTRPTAWGWCSLRSVYPNYQGPGQHFPENVKRAEPGALAEPYIVRRTQVVGFCGLFTPQTRKVSKQDLLKQLNAG